MMQIASANIYSQKWKGMKKASKQSGEGLPWWSSGYDSVLTVQGAQVQSLLREVDPTCTIKEFACYN